MSKRKIQTGLCTIFCCAALCACSRAAGSAAPAETAIPATKAPQVVFAAGSVDADATQLRLPLAAGETALLDSLPQLSAADFTGSQNEEEIAAWALAHPEVESYYTVTLPDGTQLDSGTRSFDMSGMSPAECEAYAPKLALLPQLRSVKLGREGGVHDWDSLARLRALLPKTGFKYLFTLYGKECDLSSSSLNFSHIGIADNGDALRRVIPLMPELSYVDMDSCGVSNQEMEKLRAEFPDVKFVWRVWFGESYSVRTDVQRILASKASVGGMLYPSDVEALSCCHDVVFLDLGHNKQLTDISFVASMPKLEVAILSMCDWADATPLASCPELEYLEMFSTECTDLTPLSGLTNLKHLNIAGIPALEDIRPLYNLTQLERLYLGSMNRVPWEQCEEFEKRVPNCEFNTIVYDDPTGGHWRWDADGNQVDRYYLLRVQFGYYEDEIYSFKWNDKLYEPYEPENKGESYETA